jgi:hypothetical protein
VGDDDDPISIQDLADLGQMAEPDTESAAPKPTPRMGRVKRKDANRPSIGKQRRRSTCAIDIATLVIVETVVLSLPEVAEPV